MRKAILATALLALFMSLAVVAQAETWTYNSTNGLPDKVTLVINRTSGTFNNVSGWFWNYTVSNTTGKMNDLITEWGQNVTVTNITPAAAATYSQYDNAGQWTWKFSGNSTNLSIFTTANSFSTSEYDLVQRNGLFKANDIMAATPASTPEPGTIVSLLGLLTPAGLLLRRKKTV